MPLSDKKRKVGRSIYKVQKAIGRALLESKKEHGLTQQAIAVKLGVDRSVINRRVTGHANLTLLSLAELAWALDRELVFELAPPETGRVESRSREDSRVGSAWLQLDPREGEHSGSRPPTLHAVESFMALLKERKLNFGFAPVTNDNWSQIEPGEQAKAA
jgi:transcriptional regulator with XRE-family HTH domain